MSAVAPLEYDVLQPELHLVAPSAAQLAQREMNRWMLWFGAPALVASVVVGTMFATGQTWLMGLAIAALIVQIGNLIWLAMSCDTNAA